MMRKYFIGDDDGHEEPQNLMMRKPGSLNELKMRVAEMTILADIEVRGPKVLVRVREHGGTNQYMASGMEDRFWLNKFCQTKKESGSTTFYYFYFKRGVDDPDNS